MRAILSAILCLLLTAPACQRSAEPSAADAVPEWPMADAATNPSVGAGVGRGSSSAAAIWRRLGHYGGSFLRAWRSALETTTEPPVADVLDAFNELAFAVTGPTGFWRKTVAGKWLGCASAPESAPCKRLTALEQELGQWDVVQQQISVLAADKAGIFIQKNEARILKYLDTYVPKEPSADAMKQTPFYRTQLAEVLDTWADSPSSDDDL